MSNNTEAVIAAQHEALEKIVVPGAEPPVREITPEAVAESLTAQLVDPAKVQQQKASEPITEPIFPGVHPEQKLTFGFGSGLDPLTAGFNAAAAFFNFLSTTKERIRTAGSIAGLP
jgi:hypothetical protein